MNLGAEITIFKTDCLWRAWYLKVIPNKNSTNRKKYKILKLWWGDPKILMCHGRLDYSLVNIHSLSPMKQIISLALLILGLATWPAWDKGIWEAVTVFQPLRGLDALSFLSASSLRKTYPGYPLFPGSQTGYADHSYSSCLTDPSPKRSHPGWPTTMTINIYSCMPLASYGYLLYTLLSLWIHKMLFGASFFGKSVRFIKCPKYPKISCTIRSKIKKCMIITYIYTHHASC